MHGSHTLCDIILCLVYKLFDHTTLTDESIYIGYDKRADGATVFLYCLPVQRLDLLAAQQRRFTELAPTAAATTSHSILVGKNIDIIDYVHVRVRSL